MTDVGAAQALDDLRQILKTRMGDHPRRFTTSTLATKAGLGRTTVSNALNDGHPPPSWETVAAVARALDVSEEERMGPLRRLWWQAAATKATSLRRPDVPPA